MKTRVHKLLELPWRTALAMVVLGGALSFSVAAETLSSSQYEGLVLVRGGSFPMGDVWGDSPWAMSELPVHEVEVDSFLLGKYEVTVVEFSRFVGATGYKTVAESAAGTEVNRGFLKDGKQFYPSWRAHWYHQAPDHPVVMIAWEDAIVYCNWLSRRHHLPPAYDEKTGYLLAGNGQPTTHVRLVQGFRLPTEAEWEFAAREGGRNVRFGNGQNVARSSEMNFDAAGSGKTVPKLRLPPDHLYPYNEKGTNWGGTSPVGYFRPNALGLFDMSGNAWEWCTDAGDAKYTTGKRINPCVQEGSSHIVRGGMHDTDAKACRVSARIGWHRRSFCSGSGFRIALSVASPDTRHTNEK